jgi:hypothetical protein
MKNEAPLLISKKIHEIRGKKVMLDFDLAELFGVPTKVFNQAVKRNKNRFPEDFMFQTSEDEWQFLRSQIVTLENGKGKHRKYLPFAFTEHGVAMLSGILHNEIAIAMNIAIMRAFIQLRHLVVEHRDLHSRITSLEQKYDLRFETIEQALDFLIDQKAAEALQENRRRIGFGQ